ncbi:hypothetical protein BY996DRAFT_6537372 [Phakopsora pachyrhizi]|nr:hypothetical protein BY996DRAFT_6537372 [Phakopsora pachyrhizi]
MWEEPKEEVGNLEVGSGEKWEEPKGEKHYPNPSGDFGLGGRGAKMTPGKPRSGGDEIKIPNTGAVILADILIRI